jgi:hypothetical protein
MIRPAWLFLGGMVLVVGCSAPSPKPAQPPQAAQTKSQNPFDLLTRQCRGMIHNCTCADDRGVTILAEDGQLRPPMTGKWQQTLCGIPVFFPDKDHPRPSLEGLQKLLPP